MLLEGKDVGTGDGFGMDRLGGDGGCGVGYTQSFNGIDDAADDDDGVDCEGN